jgi:hypothetical protein
LWQQGNYLKFPSNLASNHEGLQVYQKVITFDMGKSK